MFGYKNIGEALMENGFNVAFEGIIYLKLKNTPAGLELGRVVNHGDGGSNIYRWGNPYHSVKFREEAIATLGEIYEVEDAYVQYLYEESLGLVPEK